MHMLTAYSQSKLKNTTPLHCLVTLNVKRPNVNVCPLLELSLTPFRKTTCSLHKIQKNEMFDNKRRTRGRE